MTTTKAVADQGSAGRLTRGRTVLICRQSDRMVGQVISGVGKSVAIQFPESISREFQAGNRIEFHYWEDRNTVHIYDAEVLRLTGYGRQIETAILSERLQERQHRRFAVPVSVFARVAQCGNPQLSYREFVCATENVSISGLLFETTLDLRVGDKLDLQIALGRDDRLSTRAWVVRSRQIKRKEYIGTVVIRSSNAVAVEFQLLDEDQRRLLRFLLTHSAKSSQDESPRRARTA